MQRDRKKKTRVTLNRLPEQPRRPGEQAYRSLTGNAPGAGGNGASARERDSLLWLVIESFPDPFYVVDPRTYRILVANGAAGPCGIHPGALCHQLLHGSAEPCTGDNHPCPLKEVMASGRPVAFEHSHLNGGGERRTFSVHGHPVVDERGRTVRLILHSRDITDFRQTALALARTQDQLLAMADEVAEKNQVLRGVLDQIHAERLRSADRFQARIDRDILPLLRKLQARTRPSNEALVTLLVEQLLQVIPNQGGGHSALLRRLSPREMEIAALVKRGLSSKEIGSLISISEATVRKHRKSIRKKLGLAGRKTNLANLLQLD